MILLLIQQIIIYLIKNYKKSLIFYNFCEQNLRFCSPTVCRILKENNISIKKIYNKIVCKDINKILMDRENFSNEITDSFYNYISLDESIKKIFDFSFINKMRKN